MDDRRDRPEADLKLLKEVFGKCRVRVTRDPVDLQASMRSIKMDGHWRKVAAHCRVRGFDPRCYVEWRFHVEFPGYPTPAKFADAKMLDKYGAEGAPDVRQLQVAQAMALMSSKLELLVSAGEDQLRAMLDPVHCFDPVFVYSMASLSGRAGELPQEVLEQARRQAYWNPVYLDRFSELVPPDVFEGARREHRQS
jgi:hypothetical protein